MRHGSHEAGAVGPEAPLTLPAIGVVLAHVAGALLLSWAYFGHYAITRPPIGVFDLLDVALMLAGIVVVPFLYLALPHWAVIALLALGAQSLLYFTWEPVLHARWAIWLVSLGVVALDLWLGLRVGTLGLPTLVVNNVVLVIMVVGITNLWAQSGMKARDVAVLGLALLVYDVVATSVAGQMGALFDRLSGLPLAPLIAWRVGDEAWLGLGLGDVLLAAVFPLVLRKAYSRAAGITALVVAFVAITTLMLFPLAQIFPVMVVLGPLMLLQYLYWRRRLGQERTTWQYRQVEPLGRMRELG